MRLLDAFEELVKNPFVDISYLSGFFQDQYFLECYKNSETHRLREAIAGKNNFVDMSHVVPFVGIAHSD